VLVTDEDHSEVEQE
jgi:hypothetical protein